MIPEQPCTCPVQTPAPAPDGTLRQLAAVTPVVPCRAAPDAFFSNYAPDRQKAARQCGRCPLLHPCGQYARETGQEWGVWGGVDRTAVQTYCGTDRGYRAHVRDGQTPCEPCRAAAARKKAADTERRRRLAHDRRQRLAAEHAAHSGSVRGYQLHRQLDEEACPPCKEAIRQDSARRRARKRTTSAPRARARAPAAASLPAAGRPPPFTPGSRRRQTQPS